MSLLQDIQGEQTSQKRDMSTLQNMVNEVYYDEGYIQDVDPNEAQSVDDNNNQNIAINAELEEVVEHPSKKQKTSNDSNVKEASTSSGNIFKTVGNDYIAKDTIDVNINGDLADVVNGFFREGISNEKYSEIMKSIPKPENCTSLTKTEVNQLVWDSLLPQTKSFDFVI